jgi:peptide/nickel transport system permease protein
MPATSLAEIRHELTRPRRAAAPLGTAAGTRAALAALIVLGVIAIVGPYLWHYRPTAQLDIVALKSTAPSWNHPLGTDRFSRDVLARVLFGTRISLAIAILAVLVSATVGTTYGVVAGYAGGWIDAVLMRLIDALLSVPRVLLLIAVLALWNPVPLWGLILLIGLTGWFGVARQVRAQALAVRDRDFATAARALGAPPWLVAWRHVLPNVLSPVIIATTLAVGDVIVLEAGLSFLGIGAREPMPSLGTMFQDAVAQSVTAWWAVFSPGIVIVVIVMAFNTLGDALRDALDPRQLPGHAMHEHPEPVDA